jgi:hypothetical protein
LARDDLPISSERFDSITASIYVGYREMFMKFARIFGEPQPERRTPPLGCQDAAESYVVPKNSKKKRPRPNGVRHKICALLCDCNQNCQTGAE